MNLFYLPELSAKVGDLVKLIDEDAHHIDRVLRMNAGELLLISNGQGSWVIGKIRNVSKKEVEIENKKKVFLKEYKIKENRLRTSY